MIKNKNIILIMIVAVLIIGIGMLLSRQASKEQATAKSQHHDIYYCPMHPNYKSDHPGHCPICGMDLVKKITKSQGSASTVEDYTPIYLTEEKQKLIGLKTSSVEKKTPLKTIRATGEYQGQIYAEVFEDDLEFLKVGAKALVDVPAFHQQYEGAISSIDTSIDEASRTIRVRIWLKQNNQKKFKSNMFVNVEIPVTLPEMVVVSRQAVMDTGFRKIVFVSKDGIHFEPREIRTGIETDDGYEVVSGLKEGEMIVTNGNFLLDSESRIQAGLDQGGLMINTIEKKEGLIERLIGFSAQHKYLVILLVGASLVAAVWSIQNIPLDAIPDLSDSQVIIYSRWDRSPDIIEDQVTYPIVSALLGVPGIKAVRGFSDFGFSYVYVIFKDGTDIYWARSRVLEYLSKIIPRLPEGVKTELGPDATGVGWVYQYVLVDKTGKHDLQELRSYQDWYLRYHLQGVPGVAEIASLGGYVKQYQVTADPNKLLVYKIPINKLVDAVKNSNEESGGGLLEFSGAEYMVRGHGYLKSVQDLEQTVVSADQNGTPILLKNVAKVSIGSELRRGLSDLDGQGDVVGGTVVMRFGENALNVITRVKEKMKELRSSLPEGVEIKVTYDRSELILRAIENLRHQLTEEMIIVSLVILFFLWHFPSAFIPIITIPVAVILAFIPLLGLKLTSNIMSLSGIAISIGVLVDGAIVQMENVYKHLEYWEAKGRKEDYRQVAIKALKEVGPAVFFSLLVIAVSFLPIFTLVDQEGRLFKPLAWSKTFAMAIAAVLVVTLNPALRMLLLRIKPFRFKPLNALLVGRYYSEEEHPVSRILFRMYDPVCRFVLHYPKSVITAAILLMAITVPVYLKLGSEFMPALWEGSILYMPITMPGISAPEAGKLLQLQDKLIKSFPEVERVWGKSGRMGSSTDPAPLSMMETVILLKPESQWPKKETWYSHWPQILQAPLKVFRPDHISHQELIEQLDHKLQIPGSTNAWTMPIKNRIDMLSTGVRTPIGIKILGSDIKQIEKIGIQLEAVIKNISGTRTVYAERTAGGYFLDFDLKREQLARYGLSVKDAQMTIASAIGGEDVTETVEGQERYSVNVRYPSELRDSPQKLKHVLIATPSGAQIALGEIADIVLRSGPSMIRNENGMPAGYVYVDVAGRDIGSYVKEAKKLVQDQIRLPQGYGLLWSGQYENMIRVQERLKIVLPLTVFIIALLLYMNTKSVVQTCIVLLSVPFSLIGAVWLLSLLGFNVSIAVWVGMIALMGLDAETGVLLLLFMELAYKKAIEDKRMNSHQDLKDAIIHGSVRRLRPKMMTVMAAFTGLLPIMWSNGAGADVMKRIAAPMVGGLITSFLLGLLVYPAVYYLWKSHVELKGKLKS